MKHVLLLNYIISYLYNHTSDKKIARCAKILVYNLLEDKEEMMKK